MMGLLGPGVSGPHPMTQTPSASMVSQSADASLLNPVKTERARDGRRRELALSSRRRADRWRCVLFGRNTGHGGRPYVGYDMTHAFEIDPRIARRCLHAGRLQAGA